MSRRSILTAAAAGSAAVLLGPGHAAAATLVTQSEINSQPTFYEVNGTATSFRYEPGFYSRLETWHVHWRNWTPYHWTAPHKIYSYGAYVNKSGMHGEGRAFDLARNHVHIDNAISGSGDSSYSTSSTTQTYFVQAACQYIWGYSTGIDGDWGPQTQRDSSAALVRARSDGVITTQSRWLAFCKASALQAWALVP